MEVIPTSLQQLVSGGKESWNWTKNMRAASFRGVPFAVSEGVSTFGRRQAVHEYPYRDIPWVEDLGRATRKIVLKGFIVHNSLIYNAGDILTQRKSLISACEEKGAGTLIHPTLGELMVAVESNGLQFTEKSDTGRMFAFTLTLIEQGETKFESRQIKQSDKSAVTSSWEALKKKAAWQYLAIVKGALRTVTQAVKTIRTTALYWTRSVMSVADEVTNLGNILSNTFGSARYGRYSNGTIGGNTTGSTAQSTTVEDASDYSSVVDTKIAQGVQDRAAIDSAIVTLLAVQTLDEYPTNVSAVVDAVIAAVPSVYDQIRVFETLSTTGDSTLYSNSSDLTIQSASLNYLNILCGAAMAYVAADYTPTSRADGMAVLNRITTVLDRVAVIAADAGYAAIYQELQVLRTHISDVLKASGADPSGIKTVTMNGSQPALTVANQLYQDAARSTALIKSVDPVHPAFMPSTFKALTS